MKKTLSSPLFQKVIFVLSVGLIFFLSVINFRNLEKMSQSTRMVNHTYKVSLILESIFVNVKDLEITKRNYILTREDSLHHTIAKERTRLRQSFAALSSLLKDNPQQMKNLQELQLLLEEKNRLIDDAMNTPLSQKNDIRELRNNILKGNSNIYRIRKKISEMTGIENALLKKSIEAYDHFYNNSPIINLIGFLVTIGLITFSFVMMLRKLREVNAANAELTLALKTSTMAEQIGNYGTWQYNVDKNQFHFSENQYRMFGFEEGQPNEKLEEIIFKLCPDGMSNLKSSAITMDSNQTLGPNACKIETAKGETRHLRYISKLVENLMGEKILLGVTTDITEEYLNQEKMTQKNAELEEKNRILFLANETNREAEVTGNFGTAQWFVKENRFVFSDNTYRIWGIAPTEHTSEKDLFRLIHPEDAGIVEARFKQPKSEYPFIIRINRDNGRETRFISVSSKHIRDFKNEEYLLIIFVDVTEVVNAQKTILERNKELEIAYDKILLYNKMLTFGEEVGKYANWHWNINDDTWFFSENLYRMMGVEPYTFESTIINFLDFVHPEDLDTMKKVLADMVVHENMPTFNYRIVRPNGEIIYVKALARMVIDASGKKFLVGNTIDISEEVLKNTETLQKNIELEASNRELHTFNYVASHDLQEPLRKIETFITIIENKDFGNLSESGKQYFSRIKISTERMRMLIKDLLQFSKTNKSEKVFEKTDLNLLLEQARIEMGDCLEDKRALVKYEPLPTLKVIPFQIKQLFLNLMGNSLKYSKPGIEPLITITYKKEMLTGWEKLEFPAKRAYHRITFSDNGIGFEPTYADRIFELFSRLHNKDEIDGTGIGLAICKKIVDNHKGFIKGEGIPNEGSVFVIYLPD